MKLELKHLAPYLPYKLKISYSNPRVHWNIMSPNHLSDLGNDDFGQFKPILRPLSEYYKGKTGGVVMKELGCSLTVAHELWDLASGDKALSQISYECIEVMNRNHIDYNYLIDKGLAIDINTINKEG